jgi:uncharacterized YigZ family protein
MEQPDVYKTILNPSEGAYKEKGSKFLAFAFPVMDEEVIKQHIQELRQKYYDARHHCYAWQLGMNEDHFRANDDGEPSGTAGKPIHGQIRSHGVTNIVIIVVRYFGGTKLGTSGLITAYKSAAADALANATMVERTVNDHFNLTFSYAVMNDIMKIIKEEEPAIISQKFDTSCAMQLSVRASKGKSLISRFEHVESVGVEVLFTR